MILGIHTPELSSEEGVANVRRDSQEQQLHFPILVDDDKSNWDVWGNSMWPSVYLIDKEGYVRYWWYGELNWNDQGGQKIFKQRIAELVAEG